jgi:uncharacterized protein YbjT (DUF2867 family)
MSRRADSEIADGATPVVADLESGWGLADALDETQAVVHCASDPRGHLQVDVEGTRRLIEVAARSGSPHLVYPGIVGSDLIPYDYYTSKMAAENLIVASGLPWTILRATQFHQLIWFMLGLRSRLPVLRVPKDTRFQPVDPAEVARRLVDSLESGPAGRLPDIGGPHAYEAVDLARSYLAATGKRRLVWPVNYPGIVWTAFRAGANLTPNKAGGETWNQMVERQVARSDHRS